MGRKTEVNIFNTIVKRNVYGWDASNEIMWMLEKKFKSSNHGKTDYSYVCERIDMKDMPITNEYIDDYTKFWRVYRGTKDWLKAYPDTKPCFYLMGGNPEYPNEIIPIYIDGEMNYSYGQNLTDACYAAYRGLSFSHNRERVKTKREKEEELPELETIEVKKVV